MGGGFGGDTPMPLVGITTDIIAKRTIVKITLRVMVQVQK